MTKNRTDADVPISQMYNLGEKCEIWLNHIGIFSRSQLIDFGIVNAYLVLKPIFPTINLMFLYAMEAAIRGISVFDLDNQTKLTLANEVRQRNKIIHKR